MLTQEQLQSRLRYDPITGDFFWVGSYGKGRKASGRIKAGSLREDGYIEIRMGCKPYRASNLAVLYMTGVWPELVDHEDRDRANNRWLNLRVATYSQNASNRPKQANNRSGYKGVFWNTRVRKWQVKVSAKRVQYHLGFFDDVLEAHLAYVEGAKLHHGVFARA